MKSIIKYLSFMLLFVMSVISVNSVVSYNDVQNETVNNYFSSSWLGYVTGDDNILNVGDSENFTLTLATNRAYILLAGRDVNNQTINVKYYDKTLSSYIDTNYLVEHDNVVLIELQAQNIGDDIHLQLYNASGEIGYTMIFTNLGNGKAVSEITQDTVFTPLINGVVELIQINLSIWKVIYYVFIFSIIIGVIVGFILLLGKLYKFAESHQLFKKRSNHR